ncbi:MAG TPA: flagellar hook-basal body complex protein [Deltaproteobacteria bacterium]|nr:flagellar hook-basal body complex protein [Deltaproteobacteria bacterium]
MSRDLYSAVSGAFGAMRQLEVVANNIANAQTTGFKRERVAYEAHGLGSAYTRIADGLIDPRDGVASASGSPLDIALRGPGWLLMQDGARGPVLTRDGHLGVDPVDGVLRARSGHPVQGIAGVIVVPPGQTARITDDGAVIASEDGEIGRLRVVIATAEPLGQNLWRPTSALVDREPTLVAGALEASNVDPVVSMVELVAAGRAFETLHKIIQTSDELDARLNDYGRGA